MGYLKQMSRQSGTGRNPRAPARQSRPVLPLHHRIYLVLRRRLVEGTYVVNAPMPGEHQLAADFNASRQTIRRVLDRLRDEKMIDRRHGAGTFPLAAAGIVSDGAKMSYYDYIAASSHAYRDTLLEFAVIATPPFLTAVDPRFGAETRKIRRVAHLKSIPYHELCAYIPVDIAISISRRAVGNNTVLELLQSQGIVPATSELRIGAVSADTLEAQHLNVAVGSPLVQAIRISRLADGRAIEYNQILSVADVFGYRFSFDGLSGSMILPPRQ